MNEVLEKHNGKYFGTSNTPDKVGEMQLSKNAITASIAAFIQLRSSEAIARDRIDTKNKTQLKPQKRMKKQNTPCKSRYHCQDIRPRHQTIHHRTRMMGLNPTNFPRGTSHTPAAVTEAIEKTRKRRLCPDGLPNRRITFCLRA